MTKSYNSPPEHHVSRHYLNTITYGTHSVGNSQKLNNMTKQISRLDKWFVDNYSIASKLLNAPWQNENDFNISFRKHD